MEVDAKIQRTRRKILISTQVECKAFSYECTLCQPGEECDSNYNVETEKGEDYDCKQNLWSGCYFLWSRPVWKSTSDTIAQTIFAQADRVDLLLSRESAGEQTDRGRKPVGGQVRVDKAQVVLGCVEINQCDQACR